MACCIGGGSGQRPCQTKSPKPARDARPCAAGPADGTTITLDRLPLDRSALVQSIDNDEITERDFRQRLLELGLVPGVMVKVSQVAPFGDPLRIELRGAGFSLRRADAARIAVRVLDTSEYPPVRAESRRDGETRPARVVMMGNPNVGKTSLFNALTGHRGKVGNYPGITVDRLEGKVPLKNTFDVSLVDVPGTYTLNARSRDEQVAIFELLGLAGAPLPDAVVVVLRYQTLQRGLYFLMQVQELGLPVVAVVNMMDEARSHGHRVSLESLTRHFHIPFVGTVAQTGEGLAELKDALQAALEGGDPPVDQTWHWEPSAHLSGHLDEIAEAIDDDQLARPGATTAVSPQRKRAFALWCLMSIRERNCVLDVPDTLRERTLQVRRAMLAEGHDLNLEVTQSRYEHIDEDVDRYGWKDGLEQPKRDISEVIDNVLTHPFWGLLVFVATLTLIFWALFDWATPLVDGLGAAFTSLGSWAGAQLGPGLFSDFVANGLIAGVGAVVVFLPQILILFFFVALLESTGYMARAAFMMDRLTRSLGLSGHAFVPMLSGFACAVPAIMATRTIERRRDRVLTILVLPLISCSARLPVYTLILATLFPAQRRVLGPLTLGALMMLGLYVISTLLTLLAVAVLGKTVLKGKPAPLLLELPPYRLPSLRGVISVLLQRSRAFLRTAGTVILLVTIVLWALLSFPRYQAPPAVKLSLATATKRGDKVAMATISNQLRAKQLEGSAAGRVGKLIEPLIEPLGFDWKIGVGLLGSFAAREVFVSTMGLIYGVGDANEKSLPLRDAIRAQRRANGQPLYTPLTGLSLLVFFMIALQCLSTVAVARQELGGWKWSLFQLGYLSAFAYLAAFLTYQVGRALGYA